MDSLEEAKLTAIIERYKQNNCELARTLNETKDELREANDSLIRKERELQKVCDDNARLRNELVHRDNQMNALRTTVIDMVQSNTNAYTNLLKNFGFISTQPAKTEIIGAEPKPSLLLPHEQSNLQSVRVTLLRRRRTQSCDLQLSTPPRLSELVEENSLNLQGNTKCNSQTSVMDDLLDASNTTPPSNNNPIRISKRRRGSVPPLSPRPSTAADTSPSRITRQTMTLNRKTSPALASTDENSESEPTKNKEVNEEKQLRSSGRPMRRAAPVTLVEPKLTIKLRRK